MSEEPPRHLYPQADVFVLASEGESFGMVAAEAAAAGTPVIVSERCGIAGFFRDGEALVVPYERAAIVDSIRRVLADDGLRKQLARGGPAAARRMSWDHVTDAQEAIYRAALRAC
jgi:glycosyltransferase involved in cell wall biosynthesis